MTKGTLVGILNGPYTNRVAVTHLTLIGEGVPERFEPTEDAPAVVVVPGNLPGTLKAILPEGADSPAAFLCKGDNGRNWPMASGAYIDAGFSELRGVTGGHPVPLHNRYECL